MPVYIAYGFSLSTNNISTIIEFLNLIGPIITGKSVHSLSCRTIILVKLFGHRDEPDESSFVMPPVLPHYQLDFFAYLKFKISKVLKLVSVGNEIQIFLNHILYRPFYISNHLVQFVY